MIYFLLCVIYTLSVKCLTSRPFAEVVEFGVLPSKRTLNKMYLLYACNYCEGVLVADFRHMGPVAPR